MYNGYIARAAVKPQCLMQPGVTTRADIMHPHRRREDACHLSARASGRAILQRIATALPPRPKSVSGVARRKGRTGSPRFASTNVERRCLHLIYDFSLYDFTRSEDSPFIFGRKRKSFKCRPLRFIQLHSCYLELRLNLN